MSYFSNTITFIEKVYLDVSQNIRDEVVATNVVYPRTVNLLDKAEEIFYLHAQSPNYKALENECSVSINLRALDGMTDVRYILESFARLHASMLFSRVDCIVICKGGIGLVKLILTDDGFPTGQKNQTGRSAYIDINSLRIRLMNIIEEKEYTALKIHANYLMPWLISTLGVIVSLWVYSKQT